MKQTTKAALLGAFGTLAATLFVASTLPHEVKAAGFGVGEQRKFKAVSLGERASSTSDNQRRLEDARIVQECLDQQSAQGWEYVGNLGTVFIFKK